jgi:hypothetical protein
MKNDHIQWRTYKGLAGDLQTMLTGNLYGHELSRLYNDFSPFQLSFKMAKRKITKEFKTLTNDMNLS